MTFFARSWLDRILGRGAESGDPVDERAKARDAEPAAAPASTDELEEGATAARDEAIPRRADMPPPGTS